jgi:hypothetical protein
VGTHRGSNTFLKLFNAETGERRDAVAAADEEVNCGVSRCTGMKVRYEKVACTVKPCAGKTERGKTFLRSFVRDRDGSGERPLPNRFAMLYPAFERFFTQSLHGPGGETVVALYDMETGTMADLGIKPDMRESLAIPDSRLDSLMTYRIGDQMYVLDLSTIE